MKVIKSIPKDNIYFEKSVIDEGNIDSISETGIINVYDEIEYQEIIGFGGAFTESPAYNYAQFSDEQKK